MLGGVPAAFQNFRRDIGLWNVRHRIPAWFEEQEDVLAVGNPLAPASAAATAQCKEAAAAEVQAGGTGQLLPERADLVARIIP